MPNHDQFLPDTPENRAKAQETLDKLGIPRMMPWDIAAHLAAVEQQGQEEDALYREAQRQKQERPADE